MGWSYTLSVSGVRNNTTLGSWFTSARGIEWLDELVKSGQVSCTGNGFPYRYEGPAKAFAESARQQKNVLGRIPALPADGTVAIEVWDTD